MSSIPRSPENAGPMTADDMLQSLDSYDDLVVSDFESLELERMERDELTRFLRLTYFDFDDTLVKTKVLKGILFEIARDLFEFEENSSPEDVYEECRAAFSLDLFEEKILENGAKSKIKTRSLKDVFSQRFHQKLDSLYTDDLVALLELFARSGCALKIVTKGTPSFQKFKIDGFFNHVQKKLSQAQSLKVDVTVVCEGDLGDVNIPDSKFDSVNIKYGFQNLKKHEALAHISRLRPEDKLVYFNDKAKENIEIRENEDANFVAIQVKIPIRD